LINNIGDSKVFAYTCSGCLPGKIERKTPDIRGIISQANSNPSTISEKLFDLVANRKKQFPIKGNKPKSFVTDIQEIPPA
jgi:hypothetical protein